MDKCSHRLLSKRDLHCGKCGMSRYDQLLEKEILSESELGELRQLERKGLIK